MGFVWMVINHYKLQGDESICGKWKLKKSRKERKLHMN